MGAAFSMGDVTTEKLRMFLLFAVASFLLVAHIFTFNDWAEIWPNVWPIGAFLLAVALLALARYRQKLD